MTTGHDIAAKSGIQQKLVKPLADVIDEAIKAAFQTGFEHAVAGGEDAGRKYPHLKSAMPLVLYFGNEKERQEFIDVIHEAKPGMCTHEIPERAHG